MHDGMQVHAQHCCYATAGMCASASCTVCRRPREPGAHGAVCSDAGLVHGMLLDASVLARRLVAERAGLRAAAEWRGPPAGSPAYAADEAAFSGIMAALQPNPHLMVNTMWTSVRESIHEYCRVVTGAATGGPAVAGAAPHRLCPVCLRIRLPQAGCTPTGQIRRSDVPAAPPRDVGPARCPAAAWAAPTGGECMVAFSALSQMRSRTRV